MRSMSRRAARPCPDGGASHRRALAAELIDANDADPA